MHGENFEGSVPVCWIDTGVVFQISRTKFSYGGEDVKTKKN